MPPSSRGWCRCARPPKRPGLEELAARLAGVESMPAAEIGSHAIAALTWIQEKPEYGAITTQLAMVAMNLKNLK